MAENTTLWLVIMTDSCDDKPQCIECEDAAAFEREYRTHVLDATTELYAFAFRGERIRLGGLAPVGSYIIDGETKQIGIESTAINDSGHFTPLLSRPPK